MESLFDDPGEVGKRWVSDVGPFYLILVDEKVTLKRVGPGLVNTWGQRISLVRTRLYVTDI